MAIIIIQTHQEWQTRVNIVVKLVHDFIFQTPNWTISQICEMIPTYLGILIGNRLKNDLLQKRIADGLTIALENSLDCVARLCGHSEDHINQYAVEMVIKYLGVDNNNYYIIMQCCTNCRNPMELHMNPLCQCCSDSIYGNISKIQSIWRGRCERKDFKMKQGGCKFTIY